MTLDTQGATNIASSSYNPNREDHQKDTLRNILATGEFVVKTVGECAPSPARAIERSLRAPTSTAPGVERCVFPE